MSTPLPSTPLTQTQLGIYLDAIRTDGPQTYHNPFLFRINGDVTASELAEALRRVIAAAPGISARLSTDGDGQPILVDYSKTEPVEVEMLEADDESLLRDRDRLMRPFRLDEGPLAEFRVITTEKSLYLYLDFHHLIGDGTSLIKMLEKLNAAVAAQKKDAEAQDNPDAEAQDNPDVEARSAQRFSDLLNEEVTMFDIAAEEAALRGSDALPAARDSVREMIGEAETRLELIPDAKGEPTFETLVIPLGIKGEDYLSRVRELKLPQSVPATAAAGAVLSSFSRKEDIAFATIYHGRKDKRHARTFSMMVKTLPVRTVCRKETTVEELLDLTARNLKTARDNDIYSFAEAARDLGVNSQFLFAYQGEFLTYPAVGGQPMDVMPLDKPATGSDITAELFIRGGELELHIQHNAALFSRRFCEALGRCYASLLKGMLQAAPDALVSALPLMEKEEEEQALHVGDGGPSPADPSQTIPRLFADAARKYPDNIAVVYKERSLTYRELDETTDRLASLLRSDCGVKKGSIVGVLIDRSELMAVYALAVMKAGGAYMPLDPHFPEERLAFMTDDAGVALILEEEGLTASRIPGFKGKVISAKALASLPEAESVCEAEPDSPMVVLYTSGSTGKPKGVTLLQRNLVNYCVTYAMMTGLSESDRTAAYAAFGFDAHMMDLYPTLMSGASLYIIDPDTRLDLTALHRFIDENCITVIFMTTQIAWQMATLFDYTTLRVMSAGGEKLPPLEEALPYDFYNLYGPTECTVASTKLKVTGPTDGRIIGSVMPGQQIRIVDPWLRTLPLGVAGELMILGCGVGAGYLNRPELNAEKFITVDGCKAYRTGDQARFTPDGEIEYIGRMDGLVKLRGLRIELGEIENVASRHPAVKSFVAAVKDLGGNQILAGYYTLKEGEKLSADELRDFMASDLTEFMIPQSLTLLDRMPLTPNGKVDRRALPVPEVTVAEIVAPATDEEKRIFSIVAGILRHEEFGVTTNLLSVGLTSLLAMRLVAAIVKETGAAIKAKDVMSAPTVREIIAAVGKAGKQSPDAGAARPSRRYYPLTENQRGVFIDWEMNREALQYNIPQAMKFGKGTDPERLRQAVLKVVEAHPNLMTRIAMRNGDVMQERREEMPEIKITSLDSKPDALFFQERVKPFDLLGESLFRCEIFTCGEDVYMLRDTHHIIYDGVSAMIFMEDLQSAYGGLEIEKETYTALDNALHEKDLLESEEADRAAEWFDTLIDGSEPTSWPKSAHPDNDIAGGMGRLKLRIPATEIKEFCKRGGVTPSNFMLSAFLQILHRIVREEKVQITTVNNGRADTRLLRDTGMFVKTLPVVSTVRTPDATPLEMAREVQKQFLTSQDYDFYPFTALVEKKGVRPDIMYVFEGGVEMAGDAASPLSAESVVLALDTAKVPLTLLVFEPSEDEYELVVEYDTSGYSADDMQLMLEMTGAIAGKLPTAATIADATAVSSAHEEKLKEVRVGETLDIPYKSFIGEMERHADLTPDSPALVACDKRMSYGEFERECNRIANALIKRGVKRGDRVVILLPRRSCLITAIYGTMKAGATYIPCDPEYPADRIRLITEDSEARCIITTPDKVDLYPGKAVDFAELLEETDESRPEVEHGPDDVAYMIYTSGSTGRPKGVMIQQKSITNYLYGYWWQYYREHPEVNNQLLIVTISFDASLNNLGIPLTSGQCLVLANDDEMKDVALLSKLMLENHIDSFDITPSRLEAMLDFPEFREAMAQASHVNIGGEGFGTQLIDKIFSTGFTGRAVNEYGPTETTVGSNNITLTPGMEVIAGPPFYNDWNRIVDAWGGELPVGAVGELYIFGRGVGLGYNNLPEKTAAAYVDFHGERGYRTGDLAKWTPEGNVQILGRIDHQVKLRGLRIELGEIENVAKSFGGITAAAAAVKEVNKIQHLCLYYTACSPIDKNDLREHLAASLTDYMVPESYNELDEMPLTPNGKTNRKALPEPELVALTEYVEPEGELEKAIADAYARILHLERVGANDDFFGIGGTSISAIKVVAALTAAGHEISYKNVFATRTPRALAAMIKGGSDLKAPVATPVVVHNAPRSEFADVLESNSIETLLRGERQKIGDVLLTGATGFMGIHMLHDLLTRYDGKVYCLLRRKGDISPESRLRTLLFYYFDDTFDEEFASGRITVIEGEVTGPIDPKMIPGKVDTVINCAANVKHFSAGNDIELVNVESVRHLVDFCLAEGSRIVHVSTISIAGESVNGVPDPSRLLSERDLDLGQSLANQYVHSKFEAERLILEAIRDRGLNGKIMRVGNLSARASDGEFQVNFRTNGFMGRLRAYVTLGCAPYEALDAPCEFSPIDEVCRAILLLATTPEGMSVFHPTNNHTCPLGDVLRILNESGLTVRGVEEDEFIRRQQEVLEDPDKVEALQPLLAYNSDANTRSVFIGYENHYTNQVLYRLGFHWNYTSHEYIVQFIKAIEALDFFEE